MVKVALIDTGVDHKYINNIHKNVNIKHFCIKEGCISNYYKDITVFHGTCCCDQILNQNHNIQIIDINILDDHNNLSLDNLIIAIDQSIKENVDIINISVGFMQYSEQLVAICQKAYNNNIIIVSALDLSSKNVYPSQINTVVAVTESENQINDIEDIDFKTISLKNSPQYYQFQGKKYYVGGTSLSCARFVGKLSLLFNDEKIYNKVKILKKHFDLNLSNQCKTSILDNNAVKRYNIDNVDTYSKIGIVIFPIDEIHHIQKELITDNIVAYYDFNNKCFRDISSNCNIEDSEFDIILIINTRYHSIKIDNSFESQYPNKKIVVINQTIPIKDNIIRNIKKPVFLILGLCHSIQKFKIQFDIYQYLIRQNIIPYNITYNPLGFIYGFDVLKFPDKIIFPDIVYDINRYISNIEKSNNIDILSINIGGGISFINNHNINCFGKLSEAYLNAINIDIAILCIPCMTNIEFLKIQINNIYSYGIKKVFVVILDRVIDTSTLEDVNGLQLYKISKLKYEKYYNSLNNIHDILLYNIDDVYQKTLYRDIIAVLS